jgi:hypothetical protein
MRAGTGFACKPGPARIGHVASVIWSIQVLPIPARREDDGSSNSSRAHLEGEIVRVLVVARSEPVAVSVAAVTDARLGALRSTEGWVSGEHSETLQKVKTKRLPCLGTDTRTGLKEVVFMLVPLNGSM